MYSVFRNQNRPQNPSGQAIHRLPEVGVGQDINLYSQNRGAKTDGTAPNGRFYKKIAMYPLMRCLIFPGVSIQVWN